MEGQKTRVLEKHSQKLHYVVMSVKALGILLESVQPGKRVSQKPLTRREGKTRPSVRVRLAETLH